MEIFIIGDEPALIKMLLKQLGRWGYDARAAEDSSDALKFLRNHPVDLILLDVFLKDATAIELIPKIKNIQPVASIITMIGENTRQLELKIRSFGVLYYMEKPIEIDNLKLIIEHLKERLDA